jgi:putative NIF3 family GTP cyclohydrolase 1 type 2
MILKLKDIYNSIVNEGIKNDPRGKKGVESYLKSTKKKYDSLDKSKKEYFDKESLKNPFSDTRLLYGNPSKNIKSIMVGIDMETSEVLLADRLKSKGKKIDLILSHHPEGYALGGLYKVMELQLDLLAEAGVSKKKAKKLMDERIGEVMRKLHPGNITRPVDAARILGIPIMCAHTASDNCVNAYLNKQLKNKKPKKIQDIIDILMQEPEYRMSESIGAGPRLILGKPDNRCGKILLEMTGGTSGPKKIFKELKKAGVNTIVSMHMGEDAFKQAKKQSLNILIAGHMSSDSIGMNILLDMLLKKEKLNIIPCSGFMRVKRS